MSAAFSFLTVSHKQIHCLCTEDLALCHNLDATLSKICCCQNQPQQMTLSATFALAQARLLSFSSPDTCKVCNVNTGFYYLGMTQLRATS